MSKIQPEVYYYYYAVVLFMTLNLPYLQLNTRCDRCHFLTYGKMISMRRISLAVLKCSSK